MSRIQLLAAVGNPRFADDAGNPTESGDFSPTMPDSIQKIALSQALLLVLAVAGCGGDTDVTLSFEASVAGAPVSCSTSYVSLGTLDATAQLADARMFISAIELRDSDDTWVELALDDSEWQHQGVVLLDFEDGTGACADSGTAQTNKVVTGTVPDGSYDAVRYQVGVPFALNHNDNATAPAPFNVPGMFWTWRGGYKFVRADWMVSGGAVARWNVHVGSTGCVSGAPTEAPAQPCARGNSASVELTPFDIDTDVLAIDLAALIAGANITQNAADPPGCMSSPGEPDDCTPVFAALGIDFASGSCTNDCLGLTVFTMSR